MNINTKDKDKRCWHNLIQDRQYRIVQDSIVQDTVGTVQYSIVVQYSMVLIYPTILCYTILYHIILYNTILYYTIWRLKTLYRIVLLSLSRLCTIEGRDRFQICPLLPDDRNGIQLLHYIPYLQLPRQAVGRLRNGHLNWLCCVCTIMFQLFLRQ